MFLATVALNKVAVNLHVIRTKRSVLVHDFILQTPLPEMFGLFLKHSKN